jgi:hypothetical protein
MFERALDTERAFGHDRAMHRTYVRRRRTVAILGSALVVVLLSPLAAAAHRPGADPAPAEQRIVVIQQGDTLWSIAQQARPGSDPRETIAWIRDANGVEAGSLQVGRSLIVPAA